MNWLLSLLMPKADPLREAFDANLARRKAMRLVQSQRVKAGQSAAQRKTRAKDPLRVQA